MAVVGDILDATTIRVARDALGTFGTQLSRAATKTKYDLVRPAGEFPLVALESSVVGPALARSEELAVWANDLRCRQRGTVGAALLQHGLTGALVAGSEDAIAAGVVVGTSPGIQKWGWNFHAATAYRQVGERGIRVHDALLFDRPVSLSRWTRAIGATAADITIETPVTAHRTAFGGDDDPIALLDATWDRIPAGYRMPDQLRLDPDGTDTVLARFRARAAAA